MSGEGPDSIPTSADPRSKRPVKKRALTPVSEQAANVDALFAHPDQDIRIPTSSVPASRSRLAAPPEIVTNVQGSSAGAGSGEFHVYKASRRREYERMRLMDEELRREQDTREFEKAKAERDAKDDEKTRKNREKREKKKRARGKTKKVAGASDNEKRPDATKLGEGNKSSGIKPRVAPEPEEDQVVGSAPQPEASTSTEPTGILIHDDD